MIATPRTRRGLPTRLATIARELLRQDCVLCGAASGTDLVCPPCARDLPRLPPGRCDICALPLAAGARCGACLARPPHYARIDAAFRFDFPVDALVRRFKYGGRLALARLLGTALGPIVRQDADVVVPMPLSRARLAERGFNQALELARVVAPMTNARLLPLACRKVMDTPPQAAMPWKERARNVRRAFACDADLSGLRVAIVDDVLTTGATMSELARVLRRAGATEVVGWVVARTPPR